MSHIFDISPLTGLKNIDEMSFIMHSVVQRELGSRLNAQCYNIVSLAVMPISLWNKVLFEKYRNNTQIYPCSNRENFAKLPYREGVVDISSSRAITSELVYKYSDVIVVSCYGCYDIEYDKQLEGLSRAYAWKAFYGNKFSLLDSDSVDALKVLLNLLRQYLMFSDSDIALNYLENSKFHFCIGISINKWFETLKTLNNTILSGTKLYHDFSDTFEYDNRFTYIVKKTLLKTYFNSVLETGASTFNWLSECNIELVEAPTTEYITDSQLPIYKLTLNSINYDWGNSAIPFYGYADQYLIEVMPTYTGIILDYSVDNDKKEIEIIVQVLKSAYYRICRKENLQ